MQLGFENKIKFHHDKFEFNNRIKKRHSFDVEERIKYYSKIKKLVYLERDPRDVMVSLYFQVTGRFRDIFRYHGTISEFIRDGYFGARNLGRFRLMWAEIIARLGFPTVSYEECHRDTQATLRRILAYYEFDVDPARLSRAVANAEFGKMKRLEQSGSFPHHWLRPRNHSPKVRRGKVGGFNDVLNQEDIDYLNDIFDLASSS
jgi:hypothetical protein